MKTVNVLIVVDTMAALVHGLSDNLYMIDTSKYNGTYGEGGNNLQTAIKDGQNINWRVTPISPSSSVEITGFTGQMTNGVCVPKSEGSNQDRFWTGHVETQGGTGYYQYGIELDIEGKTLSFDPYLHVS